MLSALVCWNRRYFLCPFQMFTNVTWSTSRESFITSHIYDVTIHPDVIIKSEIVHVRQWHWNLSLSWKGLARNFVWRWLFVTVCKIMQSFTNFHFLLICIEFILILILYVVSKFYRREITYTGTFYTFYMHSINRI